MTRPERQPAATATAHGVLFTALVIASACLHGNDARGDTASDYDPLAFARAHSEVRNKEAAVPPQCYTKTDGSSNACWTCHVVSQPPNHMNDWELQKEYAFSDFAMENRWRNLFVDRSEARAAISDDEILRWIRSDNTRALASALRRVPDYPGWIPDLDLTQGFDAEGFARDASGWRAIRYKPFPGTFWPTNGNSDDVMIRLPPRFARDKGGKPSRAVAKINYAILEAAIATPPQRQDSALQRVIDEVDEGIAGFDVDGDGRVGGTARVLAKLPSHYVGGAADTRVHRYLHPAGVEYLHTVRYVDPDEATLLSRRVKELRYARKLRFLDQWGRNKAYDQELQNKTDGRLPVYAGSPFVGLLNDFGWQLQGFIEDREGRLRLQSREETMHCMGCHGGLGVTVDNTFALARKVPGPGGWRHQDLRGIADVPQAGQRKPEILTWFERVRGGDEFRANREILERFFDADTRPKRELVRRAAKGGDRDIAWLLTPSRRRALELNKAYRVLVAEQSFVRGRDTLLGAIQLVHEKIDEATTGLARTQRVFTDGRLWLDW